MVQLDDIDNYWGDAHDALEDEPSAAAYPLGIQDANVIEDQGVAAPLQIITNGDKANSSPTRDTTGGGSSPVDAGRASDAASVRSMPIIHESPRNMWTSAPFSESPTSATVAPLSSSPAQLPAADSSLTAQDRRNRHRSAIEVRSSSRLSGFFNNLMHRRDAGASHRDERAQATSTSGLFPSAPPRAHSPTIRATTPPPRLPPPTLQELGLSLSVLTSDLSPSHFSTPPWSGTFLKPHYLLLCHAQGLDVLPLVSPPAPQPYALVRRVCFKSVVVMEQRGVLVAIAGRRDGVRLYGLEEVRKAIEWRIESEGRRERDRMRREAKKLTVSGPDSGIGPCPSLEKKDTPRSSATPSKKFTHKSSNGVPSSHAPAPKTSSTKMNKLAFQPPIPENSGPPPSYTGPSTIRSQQDSPTLDNQSRSRRPSVNDVLAGTSGVRRRREATFVKSPDPDSKHEWEEASSDDEAINVVAAGASGSQALDERTSAIPPSTQSGLPLTISEARSATRQTQTSSTPRRNRSATLSSTAMAPPSPTPTLLALRQTLSRSQGHTPGQEHGPDTQMEDLEAGDESSGITLAQALLESRLPNLPPIGTRRPQQPILLMSTVAADTVAPSTPRTSDEEDDQEDDQDDGGISLAQALMESRLPHLPPAGTRQPQQPIFITHAAADAVNASFHRAFDTDRNTRSGSERRRRWSVFDGMFSHGSSVQHSLNNASPPPSPVFAPDIRDDTALRERPEARLTRSHSSRSQGVLAGASGQVLREEQSTRTNGMPPSLPDLVLPSSRSGFIPRIISKAFHPRRSDEHFQMLVGKTTDDDRAKHGMHSNPAPKLYCVKLPGTKGAVLVKAVETPKKNFLAILCGDNGTKVELYAGTYRSDLKPSRTFILPDSPRSLELQLQGDDLVEVFLIFSQNVFGLEPATVRVREVRIGRAERRAARRRARLIRTEESVNEAEESQLGDDETHVNFISAAPNGVPANDGDQVPSPEPETATPPASESPLASTQAHSEELVALTTTPAGPYTTFQQLSFAPNFPLASIADGYIIPPTYPEFLQYRAEHEPESKVELSQIQISPPGLPVPANTPPCKWLYRDPKGVIQGPWGASMMQAWYKEGLLPPDLPVKKEGDDEFIPLKDLRLQCVDPNHPFRSPAPPSTHDILNIIPDPTKPLLQPISILSQPKHFGPPSLFFSSRGHSTTIVDERGRSVLKGRFMWSYETDDDSKYIGRMGDVKRLEAFDIKDRAVLVAMRQGGLEAVEFGDALLRPADGSRTVLPHFHPSTTSRRKPFVWKIGTPVFSSPTSSTVLTPKSRGSYVLPGKKQSMGPSRSPIGKTEFSLDGEDGHDEVLFLGRKDDEMYICERNAGSFRILRLCPS